MKHAAISLLVVVVVAAAAATLLRLTAPAEPDPTAAITALAVPRTVVVGDRISAYGAAKNGSEVPVDRRFGVCDELGCFAAGWGEVPPSIEWHGFAGAFEPISEGRMFSAWLIAEGADGAGARAAAVRSVVVEAVAAEHVHDAQD